jgi:hypothetical protein
MEKIYTIKSLLNYPEHHHPHGVENTQENDYRIWVCEDCAHMFTDKDIRSDAETGIAYHICKSHPNRKENRCESHLEPYLPELKERRE